MNCRSRLLLLAVTSGVYAAVLGLILAPSFIGLLQDVLHVGCTLESDSPSRAPEWVCPDGIGYVLPGLMFVAAIAAVIFTIRVELMIRRRTRQGAGPELRRVVARDLGWLGAAPLVLQAPVSGYAAMSSAYSARALSLGVLVGVAGLLPFLTTRAHSALYLAACLASAVAALAAIGPAFLLAPFIMGCAALLLCAATVSILGLIEERRRSGYSRVG